MKIERLRRMGAHTAVALSALALISAGPVQAVEIEGNANIASLADTVAGLTESDDVTRESYQQIGEGEASYYGVELAGNRTASGERFDPQAMTAAHRTLPLGTSLRVTNKANGRSVVVRVNDRGPFSGHRIIDMSLAAARQIHMVGAGKAQVTLEVVRRTVA